MGGLSQVTILQIDWDSDESIQNVQERVKLLLKGCSCKKKGCSHQQCSCIRSGKNVEQDAHVNTAKTHQQA